SIPVKIDPDFLIDSIVELRFRESINSELVLGEAHSLLRQNGYRYLPGSMKSEDGKTALIKGAVLYSDVLKISFQSNSIIFNHNKEYPTWQYFKSNLMDAYKIIVDQGRIFSKPFRIGLRYINAFAELDVYEIINPKFAISIPTFNLTGTHVKTEIVTPDHRIVLNLGNGFSVAGAKRSIIDIDIIKELGEAHFFQIDELDAALDAVHGQEKELMFKHLLSEEYLKTLNVVFQ
ncbi:MAG: TIGR04255 family protein, partial [Imperialibacter sp.]|uniref:TIGR04255 family protein n=1 Tax=Imperialibacter sp. TaxID=2038411 RepID=UPI0032F02967